MLSLGDRLDCRWLEFAGLVQDESWLPLPAHVFLLLDFLLVGIWFLLLIEGTVVEVRRLVLRAFFYLLGYARLNQTDLMRSVVLLTATGIMELVIRVLPEVLMLLVASVLTLEPKLLHQSTLMLTERRVRWMGSAHAQDVDAELLVIQLIAVVGVEIALTLRGGNVHTFEEVGVGGALQKGSQKGQHRLNAKKSQLTYLFFDCKHLEFCNKSVVLGILEGLCGLLFRKCLCLGLQLPIVL